MKKFLFSLLSVVALCSSLGAQEKVDEYYNSYFEKIYKIEASQNNGDLSVYFGVEGDSNNDNVMFGLDNDKIDKFIEGLVAAKQKYGEWVDVAKANNVTKMTKEMDIIFPRVTVCWYGSKWWFDFAHKIQPVFMITTNGNYVCVFSGKAQASSNEYIDQKYYLALSSVEDFDTLIAKLDPTQIKEKLNSKQQVEDLFQ